MKIVNKLNNNGVKMKQDNKNGAYALTLLFGGVLASWIPSGSLVYQTQTNPVFIESRERYNSKHKGENILNIYPSLVTESPECMEIANKHFQAIIGGELATGVVAGLIALLSKNKKW